MGGDGRCKWDGGIWQGVRKRSGGKGWVDWGFDLGAWVLISKGDGPGRIGLREL